MQWTDAYRGGQLDYYGGLDELARYSILVGYVGWVTATMSDPPSVLDIGCGTGLLRERLGRVPLANYLGVDLSETAIDTARSRESERTRYVVSDVLALELEPFDVVVLNEVLYYAPDGRRLLKHVQTLLKPGGFVLVSMWRHPGDRALWRTVNEVFPIVDRVDVRDGANPVNRRGWSLACCKSRVLADAANLVVPTSAPSAERGEVEDTLPAEGDDGGKRRAGGAPVEG
jgi:2-polyprenyl-6-hydroxyphenyl methylase/3-demethylubiquinone-9 3-methyltransferase